MDDSDEQRRKKRRAEHRSDVAPPSQPLLLHSAWRAVLDGPSERGFLHITGFDRPTFSHLLSLFSPVWESSPHRDSSLRAVDVLGLVLHFLSCSAGEETLCYVFALPPETVSPLLREGVARLREAVRDDRDSRVAWPTPAALRQLSSLMADHLPDQPNVFGFVDGVHFHCDDPPDSDSHNAYYNPWKRCCSQNAVLVFAADGAIIWATYNTPGSWHDSNIARRLFGLLLDTARTPAPYALAADPAFPRGRRELAGRIITPPEVGDAYAAIRRVAARDRHSKAAQEAKRRLDWGLQLLQSGFARLTVPLPYEPLYTRTVHGLIFSLFNLRCRRMQLTQARSVYHGPPLQALAARAASAAPSHAEPSAPDAIHI